MDNIVKQFKTEYNEHVLLTRSEGQYVIQLVHAGSKPGRRLPVGFCRERAERVYECMKRIWQGREI